MEELKTMVSAEFLEIATEVKNVVDRAYAIRERQTYAILFQVNKGKFVDDGEMGYRLRGSILTVAEKPLWDKFIASLSSPLEEGKELPSDEEIILRKLLWIRHDSEHFAGLYGDDGEMQCGICGIDFKRMSAQDIENIWVNKATKLLKESQSRSNSGEARP
jgi:hypothetical protein